uniref:CSON010068 protein n=1 Tax=Culicoides sonorensis TaxID=179676 RepID=A0A336MDA9_CULSO
MVDLMMTPNVQHQTYDGSHHLPQQAQPLPDNWLYEIRQKGKNTAIHVMDLVKSHLMFAVREEVEVLKEKIAELMDRINQLEVENTILKANATQETLSQIQTSTTQQQVVSNPITSTPPELPKVPQSQNNNPANGPVS